MMRGQRASLSSKKKPTVSPRWVFRLLNLLWLTPAGGLEGVVHTKVVQAILARDLVVSTSTTVNGGALA